MSLTRSNTLPDTFFDDTKKTLKQLEAVICPKTTSKRLPKIKAAQTYIDELEKVVKANGVYPNVEQMNVALFEASVIAEGSKKIKNSLSSLLLSNLGTIRLQVHTLYTRLNLEKEFAAREAAFINANSEKLKETNKKLEESNNKLGQMQQKFSDVHQVINNAQEQSVAKDKKHSETLAELQHAHEQSEESLQQQLTQATTKADMTCKEFDSYKISTQEAKECFDKELLTVNEQLLALSDSYHDLEIAKDLDLDKLRLKIEELENQLQQNRADFENFKAITVTKENDLFLGFNITNDESKKRISDLQVQIQDLEKNHQLELGKFKDETVRLAEKVAFSNFNFSANKKEIPVAAAVEFKLASGAPVSQLKVASEKNASNPSSPSSHTLMQKMMPTLEENKLEVTHVVEPVQQAPVSLPQEVLAGAEKLPPVEQEEEQKQVSSPRAMHC